MDYSFRFFYLKQIFQLCPQLFCFCLRHSFIIFSNIFPAKLPKKTMLSPPTRHKFLLSLCSTCLHHSWTLFTNHWIASNLTAPVSHTHTHYVLTTHIPLFFFQYLPQVSSCPESLRSKYNWSIQALYSVVQLLSAAL